MTDASNQPHDHHVTSAANEILVATPHVDLVENTLRVLGIGEEPVKEDSPFLGLTRLTFSDNLLTDEVRKRQSPRWKTTEIRTPEEDPVGMLITAIKESIANEWANWVPTIGRNRLVGHVTGTNGGPIISGDDPQVIPRPDEFKRQDWADLEPAGEDGKRKLRPGVGVRVGIVDTALRDHPWLNGARILPQPVPLRTDSSNMLRAAHGTAIAGVVLQRATGIKVDLEGALDVEGYTTSWEAANAIGSFALSGIDILNLSFTCYTTDGLPPLALATAIDRLDPRIVVVAAAGNYADFNERYGIDFSKSPAWPAALDDVVAVGAATKAGNGWTTATFSPKAPWVDIVAPGVRVPSLLIGKGPGVTGDPGGRLPDEPSYAEWSGTSLATAIVTGTIAKNMVHTLNDDKSAISAWKELFDGLQKLQDGPYSPRLLT
ncbi:MAG: S8/S53 family peptidase [Nakamurella sp.]